MNIEYRIEEVGCEVVKCPVAKEPRIVHRDVDRSEVVQGGSNDRPAAFFRCNGVGIRNRYTAVLQDLLGPSFCRALVRALAIDGPAQIVDDDVRATRREQQSIFAADSSAPNETP